MGCLCTVRESCPSCDPRALQQERRNNEMLKWIKAAVPLMSLAAQGWESEDAYEKQCAQVDELYRQAGKLTCG